MLSRASDDCFFPNEPVKSTQFLRCAALATPTLSGETATSSTANEILIIPWLELNRPFGLETARQSGREASLACTISSSMLHLAGGFDLDAEMVDGILDGDLLDIGIHSELAGLREQFADLEAS